MKVFGIVMLSLLAVLILIGSIVMFSIIGFRNECVNFDKTIGAQVTDMKAKYNEYFLKVKESAQVPEAQMSKLKEFYDTLIKGRAADGAMMKWITESNIPINQDTYVEIQRIIASGRSEIYGIQKVHIDTVREYNTYIKIFPNNMINCLFDYTDKTATVPITENVDKIFTTGKDEVIKVF